MNGALGELVAGMIDAEVAVAEVDQDVVAAHVVARGREDAVEESDQRRRRARHLKPRGRLLQPAYGRSRAERAAALRRLGQSQLGQGIGEQGVAVVGILVSTGDRGHAETQHRRQRVDHQRRVRPVPNAALQRIGQAEPEFRLAQKKEVAVRRDQSPIKTGGNLLASNAWKIKREKGIFVHGSVALWFPGENDASTTNA